MSYRKARLDRLKAQSERKVTPRTPKPKVMPDVALMVLLGESRFIVDNLQKTKPFQNRPHGRTSKQGDQMRELVTKIDAYLLKASQ